jgi:hypothetical protein
MISMTASMAAGIGKVSIGGRLVTPAASADTGKTATITEITGTEIVTETEDRRGRTAAGTTGEAAAKQVVITATATAARVAVKYRTMILPPPINRPNLQ